MCFFLFCFVFFCSIVFSSHQYLSFTLFAFPSSERKNIRFTLFSFFFFFFTEPVSWQSFMLISVISPNCEEAKEKNGGFDFLFVFALTCSHSEQQFIQKTLCTDITDTYGSVVSSYKIIFGFSLHKRYCYICYH